MPGGRSTLRPRHGVPQVPSLTGQSHRRGTGPQRAVGAPGAHGVGTRCSQVPPTPSSSGTSLVKPSVPIPSDTPRPSPQPLEQGWMRPCCAARQAANLSPALVGRGGPWVPAGTGVAVGKGWGRVPQPCHPDVGLGRAFPGPVPTFLSFLSPFKRLRCQREPGHTGDSHSPPDSRHAPA